MQSIKSDAAKSVKFKFATFSTPGKSGHYMPNLKRNTYRVYLDEQDSALLGRAIEATEFKQGELLNKLTSAALRALAENGNRFTTPLKLRIVDTAIALNEPEVKSSYRRK